MSPNIELIRDSMSGTLEKWAVAMRKEIRVAVVEGGRRITRQVIALTPPASGGNGNVGTAVTGRDAFLQGQAKISRNMHSVLVPVKLKHKRKERWPDAEAAYRQFRKFRDTGVGVRVSRGPLIFVDERKFKALFKRKVANVGRMASGWNDAANFFGFKAPAFISRHGTGRGSITVVDDGSSFGLSVVNYAPGTPPNVRFEMARRIQYAVRYVERGLRDNIWAAGLRAAGSHVPRNRRQPGLSNTA